MATTTAPTPVLTPRALYLGDNGRCFCYRHGGATATYSGRGLSGQPVKRMTTKDVRTAQVMGWTPACETCGVTQENA
jgi:hypothetical protein